MSPIHAAVFYQAACDACGWTDEGYDGITHWSARDHAVERISDSDGLVFYADGRYAHPLLMLCENCASDVLRASDEAGAGVLWEAISDRQPWTLPWVRTLLMATGRWTA